MISREGLPPLSTHDLDDALFFELFAIGILLVSDSPSV